MTTSDKSLAVKSEYAVAVSGADVREVLAANLGGDTLDQFSLPRVIVPAGGSTMWMIPGIGDPEPAKAIEGVIVAWKTVRAYYDSPFGTTQGQPPKCASDDGISGAGQLPGDDHPCVRQCASCPMNQFGAEGKKPCSEHRLLFILQKDALLPIVVAISPGSLKDTKAFFVRLVQKGLPYYGVEVSLTLTQAKNAQGITYAKVVPTVKRVLEKEERDVFASYAKFFEGAVKPVGYNYIEPQDA